MSDSLNTVHYGARKVIGRVHSGGRRGREGGGGRGEEGGTSRTHTYTCRRRTCTLTPCVGVAPTCSGTRWGPSCIRCLTGSQSQPSDSTAGRPLTPPSSPPTATGSSQSLGVQQ